MKKCCLTVAGSDSGGNAGIQADLRAFHSYGVHGCTVLAALTAQNPSGVSAVLAPGAVFVKAQLDAVLGTYGIAAMKTGMLPDAETVEAVAGCISGHPEIAKVIDPVMVATSGARLSAAPAVEAAARLLFPLAAVVSPNLPEAEILAGGVRPGISGPSRAAELARALYEKFGVPFLVKGGHSPGSVMTDVLFDSRGETRFELPAVENPVSTHGTGCTLAAAIAAGLALGMTLDKAVSAAKRHVRDAIAASYETAPGCGVLGFA